MASSSKKPTVVWLEISEPSSKLCHDLELFFLRYFHAHIVTINHRRRPTRFRATTLHRIQLRLKLFAANMEKGASRESTLIDWMPRESASCCRTEIKKIHSQKKAAIDFVWASMAEQQCWASHFGPPHRHTYVSLPSIRPWRWMPTFDSSQSKQHLITSRATKLAIISSSDSSIHSRYNCIICLISLSFLSCFCFALTGSRLVGTELNTNTRRSCLAQQVECRPMQIREKNKKCWIRSRFVGGSVESRT